MKTITLYELITIVNAHIAESPAKFKLRQHKCYVRRGPQTHADLFIEPCIGPRVQPVGVNIKGETESLYLKLIQSLIDVRIESTFARQDNLIAFVNVPLSCNVATPPPPVRVLTNRRRKTDANPRPRY